MFYQLSPNPLLLLGILLLCVPGAYSAKCPQQCVCDQIQLTVACVNKNLTEVPPTVDEVGYKYLTPIRFRYSIVLFIHVLFLDYSEVGPSQQ